MVNFANDTPIFESINADPRTGGPAGAQRYLRSKAIAAFFQDDWKLRPNFTLNLGLRYEYYPPLSDTKNALSNLAFGTNGLVDSTVGHVSSLIPPDRNNFAPRIGFAWSPSRFHGSSVLRGGFGLAYNRTDALFANTREIHRFCSLQPLLRHGCHRFRHSLRRWCDSLCAREQQLGYQLPRQSGSGVRNRSGEWRCVRK
jgi:hypothetical protein